MQQGTHLTDEQIRVLKHGDTEAPFSGAFLHNIEQGIYICAQCDAVLFDSKTKFDSGSGWPSFYNVADKGNVALVEYSSHGMQRIEVKCANCNGHLGHVFHDAPDQPTGMRFCINSLALNFRKEGGDES